MIRLKDLLKEQPEIKESEYVDDSDIIKYKDKDGKPAEMKAGAAKSQKQGSPAKKAWDDANIKAYQDWDKDYKDSQIKHRMGLRQRSDYGEKGEKGLNPFQKDDPNAPNYDKNFTFEPKSADKPTGMDDIPDKKEPEAGKVSFDRTAGKDGADSKSDDKKSAPKSEKKYNDSSNIAKNDKGEDVFYIGGAGNEEEVDISYLNSNLDIGLSNEDLAERFKDGSASMEMDPDDGTVRFRLEDDNGYISAEVESGGYFDGTFDDYEGADAETLRDSLEDFLKYNMYDNNKPTWDGAYDKAYNLTPDQFQAIADEYGFEYNGEEDGGTADIDSSGFGDWMDGEDSDDEMSYDINRSIRKALHPEAKNESIKSSGNIKLSELIKSKK